MLLITTACPPVPIPTEVVPSPNDSGSVSAERVGVEPPAVPAVTPPTVPLPPIPASTSATTESFAINTAPPSKQPPQIDADPCPLPVPLNADNETVETQPSLEEQPSLKSDQEQNTVTLDSKATLTQRLIEDAAQQPTWHHTDVALEEITALNTPEALSPIVAAQAPIVAAQAPIAEGAAATGTRAETRQERPDNSLERPSVGAALPALAAVELKPPAVKDFFRQFHRDESFNSRHSQPELTEPSRPNSPTAATHITATALSSRSLVDEQHAARNIDADSPVHSLDHDAASPATFTLNDSPATTLSKSNSARPGTVTEQLASAVLNQLEAEPIATSRTFRLRLDPRELGPVEIQLTVVNDVVSIQFVAHDEGARHAISRQLDELRQSLTDSGISFGQFDVSSQTGSDHGSQSRGEDHTPQRPPAPNPFAWPRDKTHELRDERHSGHLNFVA